MKIIFCFFIFCCSLLAQAQNLDLGTFNCEHSGERFDPNLQIEYNLRFQGQASCRTDSRTYFMNFNAPVPVAQATFKITFYQEDNGNRLTLRGRLTDNSTVLFTRTSSTGATRGVDGRNWFLITYEYTGPFSHAGEMTHIEWISSGTTRIDEINGVFSDPLASKRFLKMKPGHEDIFINFNLEDVLSENILTSTFRMEGRLHTYDQGEIFAFDSAPVNPDVYVECSSVTLVDVITNPTDELGTNYSVECLPPTLQNASRGLFRITNHGVKPTFPVEFIIRLQSIPRITEDTRSASFYFPMSLKTVITP